MIVMPLHEPCATAERQAGAAGLLRGCIEIIQRSHGVATCPFRPAVRDTGPVEGYLEISRAVAIPRAELNWRFSRSGGPNLDGEGAVIRHGIARIDGEIENDLLELRGVGLHPPERTGLRD